MLRSAQSAAEYGKRVFESYALAAGRVNDRLRDLTDQEIRANEQALSLELQQISSELSQSELTYVIDRDGYPLVASSLYPVPRNSLADRDYFQALSSEAAPPIYVSQTFVGRFDGRLLFSVGRRRAATGNPATPDGFDGVVTISVNPIVLADGLTRLLPASTDRMAFMRTDGFGISTTSGLLDAGEPLPRVAAESPFYDYAASEVDNAVYISKTAMPGSEAILAMQAVEGFPVYAVSIRPQAEVVAAWWSSLRPVLGFGLPATLALFLLSLQVWRDQLKLASSNAMLRKDNELSSDRLSRTKRFGLVGTFEYDLRTGISRRSAEYLSLHDLSPTAALETHDDWVRRLHPDDRERAEREILRTLSYESGETEYGQTYRIVTPGGEIRWIAARGEIVRDMAGHALMLRGAHVDVTPLRTTEMALAESDARLRLAQEAMGIGAWEWLRASNQLRFSAKARELLGFDSSDAPRAADVFARIHPEDRHIFSNALRQMKKVGALWAELRVVRPLRHEAGPAWVAIRAKTVTSPTGSARLIGIVYDVSARKRAEELTILMAHEVEHRAKNALTVVSSLLRVTKASNASELARMMEGRIQALSQTMALLGKGQWKGVDLRQIVESELRPFIDSKSSADFVIDISGPTLRIGADIAQPLAMALHELVTNAAKYGALANRGGQLAVAWWIDDDLVNLRWQERGGPPVFGTPERSGLGSRLISMLLEGQIGGTVRKKWHQEGLVCEITLPNRAADTLH